MKATLILLACLLIGGAALAYEEPAYEILEQREGYEVRRYDAYLVAETVVEDDFECAGNQAFRRLFGYGVVPRGSAIDYTSPQKPAVYMASLADHAV